jgi:gas vesicle protein
VSENMSTQLHENQEEKKQTENNKQAEEKNQTENNRPAEEKKESTNHSVNLALIGGVVGAGIGYLLNPKTSRKVMDNLSKSEFLKAAGEEFRKTAQELLAGQAQNSVKQLASGYLSKIEEGLLSPKKEKGGDKGSGEESQRYEEVKEENKNLNERLQKIENMLSDLVETK